MAICDYCLLETNGADGCVKMLVKTIDGELDPIPYGNERRCHPPSPGHRCHDCDALPGHYHHAGCDWEECPRCHGQLLSCECLPADVEPVGDSSDSSEQKKATQPNGN